MVARSHDVALEVKVVFRTRAILFDLPSLCFGPLNCWQVQKKHGLSNWDFDFALLCIFITKFMLVLRRQKTNFFINSFGDRIYRAEAFVFLKTVIWILVLITRRIISWIISSATLNLIGDEPIFWIFLKCLELLDLSQHTYHSIIYLRIQF